MSLREVPPDGLDPTVLESLRELDGGEGKLLRTLLTTFIEQVDVRIEQMHRSLAAGDRKEIEDYEALIPPELPGLEAALRVAPAAAGREVGA